MNNRQTENSYFADKVALRLNHLPAGKTIRVLDAFSAYGRIWNEVRSRSRQTIEVTSLEKRTLPGGFRLLGDNVKFLSGMNLDKFDVIDLDAFGIPFKQLRIVFASDFRGVVFATVIQSGMGRLPNAMLEALGYTAAMIDKTPTLFTRNGFEKFTAWMANNGVTKILVRESGRKHYIAFTR